MFSSAFLYTRELDRLAACLIPFFVSIWSASSVSHNNRRALYQSRHLFDEIKRFDPSLIIMSELKPRANCSAKQTEESEAATTKKVYMHTFYASITFAFDNFGNSIKKCTRRWIFNARHEIYWVLLLAIVNHFFRCIKFASVQNIN